MTAAPDVCLRPALVRLAVVGCVGALVACGGDDAPAIATGEAVPGAADVVNLEQGWSAEVQDALWFASFGSELMPYAWFLALEQASGTARFRDDRNLAALGFLPQTATANNPDGLPVGFSRHTDEAGTEWVGLTCAACHTGEVHYRGVKLRIDGGQALLDFTAFENGVVDALSATVADSDKFNRFAAAVLDEPTGLRFAALREALVARAQALAARRRMNATPVPYGHGRLDAFGQIFNAAAVEFLGEPDNRRTPDAPVSYPVLWSAAHLDVVQWNGSAPNAGPGPLFQNITTALAVYGHIDMHADAGPRGYASSVDFDNLARIQNWLYALKAPQWPERYLGRLDAKRVERGQTHYAEHCVRCHALSDRDDPTRKLRATLTPLDRIGTDPKMVQNFLRSRSKSGYLSGHKVAYLAGDVIDGQTPTINLVVHAAMGAALRHPVKTVKAALTDYHAVYSASLDATPDYYKARPLDGIWSSAPYLHNGSVPSLYDLLLPAAQRPVTFHVGSREFDPARVGLDTGPGPDRSAFDTRDSGNSNAGHEFATQLSEAQRLD
ncbi:MAG: di-heme-cytochrome C peroxidase, partial [Pseudomonadota bacterium]